MAEQDGRLLGYASWHRGQGWGASAVLKISDLIATTADGYRALLADFASFAGLLGELEINSSGLDLVRHLLPTSDWRPGNSDPYMIKILDLPGALSARGYPTGVRASLDFGVAGDPITGIDGRYRLELESGRASCVRTGDLLPDAGVPVFTPGGLAIAYAGTQSCQGIRMVGGLSGPETDDDVWTTVFAGRPVRIHDHF